MNREMPPRENKEDKNNNKYFTEKSKNLDSAVRFFSEPKKSVDEKQKALDFFTEEISNIPKEEVLSIYQKMIDQKKFTLSKNNIKILYFAFTKLEDQEQKNELLQIVKDLEKYISSPMLHFYIEEMISLMDGTKKENSGDKVISKISKDRYGAIFEDGNLYLSDINESEIVSEKLKSIKQPTSYEEDQARIKAVRDVSTLLFNNGPINSKKLHNSGVIENEQDLNFQDQYDEYLGFLDNISKRVLLEKFGFNFNDLTLQEQFQFISFIKDQTLEKVEPIMVFSKKFENNGFRTFLSIEQGGKEMGDKIISLGEKLPEDITQKVFTKYGEIIDIADKAEEEIRKIFGDIEVSNKVLVSTKETLLKRGQKMLSDLGDKVLDRDFKINEQDILNELEDIKAETIILGESYVKFYKEGIKVPIEDVTKIEQISTQDLTEDEKKELLKVYENGRPKVTYENKEHLELLKEEFKQELENKDTLVFNIRFNGDIIIFAIVDKKDKDTLYIGGLTFTDEVRNPVIAEASMNCVLDKFKNYNIRALVDSRNPILSMYQKRFGFKIVGELPRDENAGELYYEIEKSKSETDKMIEIKEELEKAA